MKALLSCVAIAFKPRSRTEFDTRCTVIQRIVACALLTLMSCSDGTGERWLLLDHDELSGQNRLCIYRDWPGEYVLTVHSWESCEPSLEVD
jgi:hypothetical protein